MWQRGAESGTKVTICSIFNVAPLCILTLKSYKLFSVKKNGVFGVRTPTPTYNNACTCQPSYAHETRKFLFLSLTSYYPLCFFVFIDHICLVFFIIFINDKYCPFFLNISSVYFYNIYQHSSFNFTGNY